MSPTTQKVVITAVLSLGAAIAGAVTGIIDPISGGVIVIDSVTNLWDLLVEAISGE